MSFITKSRVIATRVAARPVSFARMFSSECEPAQRIKDVLAEYKRENFSREIPTRFRKELLQPYVGSSGTLEVDQLNLLLQNIGHPQDVLSASEQKELLRAAGCSGRSISVTKMMELIE